jgi:shikimate dehydrogenase
LLAEAALPAHRTRLGVLGWPVAQSRSPAIQNAALRAAGLGDAWRYQLLPVPPELLAETIIALPAAGFRGVNVTIPHKQAALALADEATPRAKAIGAANTLTFEPQPGSRVRVHADNTDAPALIDALPFSPAGKTALVLGAGGSARAAIWALIDAGAKEVRVWNRTPERAERLAAELGAIPVTRAAPANLLIHCTSSGMDSQSGMLKTLPITADSFHRYDCVVDFVYRDTETPLVTAARERTIPVVEGLELLIGQGKLSFERFTGVAASHEAMLAAARHG